MVVLIDNGLYAIEQYLIDPKFFADPSHAALPYVGLNRWDYASLAKALGAQFIRSVSERAALAAALKDALAAGATGLISVRVDPRDLPPENRPTDVATPAEARRAFDAAQSSGAEPSREYYEIARLGATVVEADGSTTLTGSAERAGRNTIRLHGEVPYRVVVQKGRSFQRANPHVRVHVDRGRYLVIELPESTKLHEEPGCFAVAEEGRVVGFRVERAEPRSRREDVIAILDRLAANDLRAKVQALANLHNRFSLLPRFEPAVALAETWLSAAGCSVRRASVPMPGGTTVNLVGERQGASALRRLYIIGAHLDSVNHDAGPNGRAPGADDNATGSATVVAMAEAVSNVTLRDDVRFILFGGEEQGLFGSQAYVAELSAEDRARLGGVVTIDMAGSKNTPTPSVLLEGGEVSRGLMNALAQAAATYTTLETQLSFSPFASDHVPFIENGLPAVLTIEGSDNAYAHEHTERDTPDRLDFTLHKEITKMNLAWLLEQTI